jgi:hypothetical protein
MDPVSEFAALTQGKPLMAGPAQDHPSHMQCHMVQASTPGLPPQIVQQLMAHMVDHIGKHYAGQVAAQTGMQPPPPQMGAPQGAPMPPPGMQPPCPPPPNPAQIDAQIAGAVAKASDALRQAMAQLAPPTPGGDPLAAQKLEVEKMKLAAGQKDDERKAFAQANQNQTELIRLAQVSKDGEADRQAALAKGAMDLEREKIKSQGVAVAATLQHVVPVMAQQTKPQERH